MSEINDYEEGAVEHVRKLSELLPDSIDRGRAAQALYDAGVRMTVFDPEIGRFILGGGRLVPKPDPYIRRSSTGL